MTNRFKVALTMTAFMLVMPVSCIDVFCELVGSEVCEEVLAADQRVEFTIGESDLEGTNAGGTELDAESNDIAIRYFHRFGDGDFARHLSWGIDIQRSNLEGVDGGSNNFMGMIRAEAGPPGFGVHIGAGFGMMLSDVAVVEREVETSSTVTDTISESGQKVAITEVTNETTLVQTEQETGGMWHAEIGFRGAFMPSVDRTGWVISCGIGGTAGDGFTLDEARGCSFAITIAAESRAS